MRTTLSLDDDVAQRLKDVAHRERKPFKVVVNEAIRVGLGLRNAPRRGKRRPVIKTFHSRFKVGIDEGKLNQLVDQLEVESFVAESLKS